MAKQTDFNAFLSNIEPSQSTIDYISSVQINLRNYLECHAKYKSILIDSFLSGSYAKHTSIRPAANDKKRDVDIIVVTNYEKGDDSADVLQELCDVLKEKSLYKSAVVQSHSVSLELSGISVDVVPVIEHEISDLFYVGSSKDGSWKVTDPKGHISWSTETNKSNNNEYKPLVKIFKWWRRTNCPSNQKYPKGITLEKIIADNLGDSSLSTEDFFIETMQNIINSFSTNIDLGTLPYVGDPSKHIVGNNLLSGYSFSDFKSFYNKLDEHLKTLNENGTENDVWREILGNEFPPTPKNSLSAFSNNQSYLSVPHRQKPKWPMRRSGAVFISAKVTDRDGHVSNYENDSYPLDKNCDIVYTATYNSCKRYKIMWQIVNTGYEAQNCLRGGFEVSNVGNHGRKESTAYSGKHYVQCFVIDSQGFCVARSKEFFINIK